MGRNSKGEILKIKGFTSFAAFKSKMCNVGIR